MVRIIGRSWKDLYEICRTKGKLCESLGRYYRIIVEMEGRPLRDPENPAYYAVQLRCGWGPTHIPHLGGTVGGLTYEQWLFLKHSKPRLDAVLAVGPVWTSLEDAIRKARAAGVEVTL